MSDEPATLVFGVLLHRQLNAWQSGNIAERDRLFHFISQFEAEFPEECKVWSDRYSPLNIDNEKAPASS